MRCGGMDLEYAFRDLMRSPYLMGSEKSRAVATAVRLLQTHMEKSWTVASLAREVGQSRSTFAATFSACVGTGPIEYLSKLRMERAAALLAEHRLNLPLTVIAHRVGYEAPSSFARAFRTHFGLSPRAFGRRNTEAARQAT
jgi:transcriptional regulator GlxA family with amidase domain